MKNRQLIRSTGGSLIAVLVATVNAVACPDCALKNSGGVIEPQTVMAKMAFASSTLLLLGIVFSVGGFLIVVMIRACRDFSREHPLSKVEGS